MITYHKKRYTRGFTVFFAMLVGTLTLTLGIVLYDLLIRSLTLSQVAKQSQFAIYAADTAIECALYWDFNLATSSSETDGSAFATSSATPAAETGSSKSILCSRRADGAQHNIAANGTPPASFVAPDNTWTAWTTSSNASAATTTFYIAIGNPTTANTSPCAKVEVGKTGNPSRTTIIAHGFNTCLTTTGLRVERTLQVNY